MDKIYGDEREEKFRIDKEYTLPNYVAGEDMIIIDGKTLIKLIDNIQTLIDMLRNKKHLTHEEWNLVITGLDEIKESVSVKK